MQRESFDHEEVARTMNEHFVSMKVDWEQRPVDDDVYMTALLGRWNRIERTSFEPASCVLDQSRSVRELARRSAAAPVVALGAPFGAIVVNWLPRAPNLIVVSVLCVGQFVWTHLQEQLPPSQLAATIVALGVVNLGFHLVYKMGSETSALTAP